MAQNIDAATMAATNPEISGTDEIIGTVNDKHTRTMADLEARAAKARQEKDRLRRARKIRAILNVIGSAALCIAWAYVWWAGMADPAVAVIMLCVLMFNMGHTVGGHPRVFMPWRFRR